jgi:hypothetical protein
MFQTFNLLWNASHRRGHYGCTAGQSFQYSVRKSVGPGGVEIDINSLVVIDHDLSATKICGQPVDQAANPSAWASADASAGVDWPYSR